MIDNASRRGQQNDQWIVCQIGAREHYVLAHELHRRGQLAALCTDIWAAEGSVWNIAARFSRRRGLKLHGRYEPSLSGARVLSESPFTLGALSACLAIGQPSWPGIMAANRRFAQGMARRLERSGLLRSHRGGETCRICV